MSSPGLKNERIRLMWSKVEGPGHFDFTNIFEARVEDKFLCGRDMWKVQPGGRNMAASVPAPLAVSFS